MRYFKIEPFFSSSFVGLDDFSYCKVSSDGMLFAHNFKYSRTISEADSETKIHPRFLEETYGGETYRYLIVEELDEESFNLRIKAVLCMQELVD